MIARHKPPYNPYSDRHEHNVPDILVKRLAVIKNETVQENAANHGPVKHSDQRVPNSDLADAGRAAGQVGVRR